MTQRDLQKYRIDMRYRLAFYSIGLGAASVLALAGSQYAGEAFALVGGLMGGDAISGATKHN